MAQDFDLTLDNIGIELVPQPGEPPLAQIVHTLYARVTDATLEKGVKAVLELVGDRAPIDVEFQKAHFVPGGAEITVEAGTGRLLRAKATAVVSISAHDSDVISVRIDEIRALGRLPVEGLVSPLIEKALGKASDMPGIELDPSAHRAILVSPNGVLKSQGIDLTFVEPGSWTVNYGQGWMGASFHGT